MTGRRAVRIETVPAETTAAQRLDLIRQSLSRIAVAAKSGRRVGITEALVAEVESHGREAFGAPPRVGSEDDGIGDAFSDWAMSLGLCVLRHPGRGLFAVARGGWPDVGRHLSRRQADELAGWTFAKRMPGYAETDWERFEFACEFVFDFQTDFEYLERVAGIPATTHTMASGHAWRRMESFVHAGENLCGAEADRKFHAYLLCCADEMAWRDRFDHGEERC